MSFIQHRADAAAPAHMAGLFHRALAVGLAKVQKQAVRAIASTAFLRIQLCDVRRSLLPVSIACVAILGLLPLAVHGNSPEATSSRAARDEAMRAIPWRKMPPDERRIAQNIVKNASMYRRLPTRVIDCDPEMFNFLLQHPEVVIDVWRVMGISQVALQRLSNGAYRGSDNAGTTGTVRFLFSQWGPEAQNLAVVFADGTYDGKPFLTPLKARSIILLRSGAVRETNGRHYVTVRVDSFVRIEQMGIELIAKTVQPWISKTADRNFIETLSFVSNFSRTAEKNPQGMQRLATRLASIDETTRKELVAVCFRTAERYAQGERRIQSGEPLLAHRGAVGLNQAR
jgi:hypothetical protein